MWQSIDQNVVSLAKKHGHDRVTWQHVAVALATELERREMDGLPVDADCLSAGLPPDGDHLGRPSVPDDIERELSAVAGAESALKLLLRLLDERRVTAVVEPEAAAGEEPAKASGEAAPAPSDAAAVEANEDASEVFALPARYSVMADVVQPDPSLVPRPEVVDELITALGTLYRSLPVVVAEDRSGRSTLPALLITRMTDTPLAVPLAVVHVHGARARVDPQTLHSLIRFCRGRAVVVLDDLEVLLGLGGPAPDLHTLAVLRSTLDDVEHRLVGLLSQRYRDKLSGLDQEFSEEITWIPLPHFTRDEMTAVTNRIAGRLSERYSISIDGEALTSLQQYVAATGDGLPGEVARAMDVSAHRAKLGGRDALLAADFPMPQTSDAVSPQQLQRLLAQDVFGQNEAIERVASVVSRARNQLDARNERPDGVFLFAGPTGTGKTELARALARRLHGSLDSLVRLDMSEFSSEHTIANLIGSPPGYVGFDSPDGWLTTRIRRRPNAVLLLDEIEKAHPVVWNAFLQVFDAGRMTDAAKGVVDFSRVTIIATTNLGSRAFERKTNLGFAPASAASSAEENAVREALKQVMNPELLNRFDAVIVFRPLARDAVKTICRQAVETMCERMADRGWTLQVSDDVVAFLAEKGYSPEYGARELQRTVDRLLLEPLMLLPKGSYTASVTDGMVALNA